MIELEFVSKLFRAYGLYNEGDYDVKVISVRFQSSFELTGYITHNQFQRIEGEFKVSKLFRAYGLYNH